MKRKAGERGIGFFFKPIGSSLGSNIASAENANPSEEANEQEPIVDDSSNPIDGDQNIVEPVQDSEQGRTGSTAYERDPGKRQQIYELPIDKQEEARRFYAHWLKSFIQRIFLVKKWLNWSLNFPISRWMFAIIQS